MGYLWLVGVVLVTSASTMSTVGVLLMKKSFGDTGEHENVRAKLIWGSGLFLMILGAILDFVAFGFAAQSLIAPLGSVTLLCNVILAPLMLGESVARSDWAAAAIIAAGCTIAIAFGDHETKTYEFDELMDLYDSVGVQIYLPFMGLSVAAMFLFNFMVEKKATAQAHLSRTPSIDRVDISCNDLHDPELGECTGPSTARSTASTASGASCTSATSGTEGSGSSDGETAERELQLPGGFLMKGPLDVDDKPVLEPLSPKVTKQNKKSPRVSPRTVNTTPRASAEPPEDQCPLSPQVVLPYIPQRMHMLHGGFYAAAGGLAGSCSVLFGKSVAEIVKPGITDGDGSGWGRYETYLIIMAMSVTLYFQMKGLNGGLAFHPAVFVLPVYQTCWIMGSIVGGGVYFREFEDMSTLQMTMFCLGVATCIGGVFVLTYFRWDSEMAKYQAEMGLKTTDPVEDLALEVPTIGVPPRNTQHQQPLPTMGNNDSSPSQNQRAADSESDSDPHAANRSQNVSSFPKPSASSKPKLPPINDESRRRSASKGALDEEEPVESKPDARQARNLMRKKRMLRKKGMPFPEV